MVREINTQQKTIFLIALLIITTISGIIGNIYFKKKYQEEFDKYQRTAKEVDKKEKEIQDLLNNRGQLVSGLTTIDYDPRLLQLNIPAFEGKKLDSEEYSYRRNKYTRYSGEILKDEQGKSIWIDVWVMKFQKDQFNPNLDEVVFDGYENYISRPRYVGELKSVDNFKYKANSLVRTFSKSYASGPKYPFGICLESTVPSLAPRNMIYINICHDVMEYFSNQSYQYTTEIEDLKKVVDTITYYH